MIAFDLVERADMQALSVADLAGKSEVECISELGEPDRRECVRQGTKLVWDKYGSEIVFIGGRADWFTIKPQSLQFEPASLAQIGLATNGKPTFRSPHVMTWNGLRDLLSVSIFPDGGGHVAFFYVKAKTL